MNSFTVIQLQPGSRRYIISLFKPFKSKARPASRSKPNVNIDPTTKSPLQIAKSNNPNTHTSPSVLADPSSSERNKDLLITQHLLQYQQSQRLLLEQLALQNVKPDATARVIEMQNAFPKAYKV